MDYYIEMRNAKKLANAMPAAKKIAVLTVQIDYSKQEERPE